MFTVMSTAVTLLLTVTLLAPTASSDTPAVSRLLDHLLSKYRKLAPPSNQTNATFSLKLIHFDYEEPKIGVFSTWPMMSWKDLRLRWEPSDYDGILNVRIPAEYLWTPDIISYLPHHPTQVSPVHAVVYHDGTIVYIPPMKFSTKCDQADDTGSRSLICGLKLGSWVYDGEQLNVTFNSQAGGLDMSEYRESQDWAIVESKGKRVVTVYPCCPEKYIALQYEFRMARRISESEGVQMTIPFALAALSPFVFLTQRKQALRLMLTAVIFAAFSLASSMAQGSVEKSGVKMDSFVVGVIILMFASFLLHLLPRYGDSVKRCLKRLSSPPPTKNFDSSKEKEASAIVPETGRVANGNNDDASSSSRPLSLLLGPAFDLACFAVSLLVTVILILTRG